MDATTTRTRTAFGNLTNANSNVRYKIKNFGKFYDETFKILILKLKAALKKKGAAREDEGEAKRKLREKARPKGKDTISTQWHKHPLLQNPFKPTLDPVRKLLQTTSTNLDTDKGRKKIKDDF